MAYKAQKLDIPNIVHGDRILLYINLALLSLLRVMRSEVLPKYIVNVCAVVDKIGQLYYVLWVTVDLSKAVLKI